MDMPEYITVDEVKRVCREVGLRDWTGITAPEVSEKEAKIILSIVNTESMGIEIDDFREGLAVELEHGTRFSDANVTNNHPILTGMIVLAHLKETLDYYKRLDVAEIEGDLLKAIEKKDPSKTREKYLELAEAQKRLGHAIEKQLK